MSFSFVFATDFHGMEIHYQRTFQFIQSQKINCLVFGGDLCPSGGVYGDFQQLQLSQKAFLQDFFINNIQKLHNRILDFQCLVIMGNDDLRINFDLLAEADKKGLMKVIHQRLIPIKDLHFLGYSNIPPTPFLIKDWEKYENSNFIIEPIAIPPEKGYYSIKVPERSTIEKDLLFFQEKVKSKRFIFVSHCPPYKTLGDQSKMDHYYYEGLKLDKHLGSTSIRNFIESTQPLISLHGHIHESTNISGKFHDHINETICLNGAFKVENTDATEILLIEISDKILFEKVILT